MVDDVYRRDIEEGHGHDRMKFERHLDLSLTQSYYKR